MSVIDATDIAFNGKEIMALSEAIMERFHEKPVFSLFHKIVPGIKAKQQIAILGLLGLVGKKSTGCAPDENSGGITMSGKEWDPEYIEDRFAQCWKDLKETFFIWGLKNGIAKGDLTSTDFSNFLEERLSDAMIEAIYRLAWMGDVDAANYNDSPSGTITNSIDPAYFTPIDGFWKQIFAIGTATPARKVTIAKNAEATYVDQEFDSTDTTNKVASGIFRDLLQGADYRLRSQANKVIVCTQSLADQYENELESQGVSESFKMITEGVSTLERKGTLIIAVSTFDRHIRAYQDSGTAYYRPHRAVLLLPDNTQIGTEEEANLAQLKPFYDQKENKYYVDFGFNLDAKIPEDYLIQAAY